MTDTREVTVPLRHLGITDAWSSVISTLREVRSCTHVGHSLASAHLGHQLKGRPQRESMLLIQWPVLQRCIQQGKAAIRNKPILQSRYLSIINIYSQQVLLHGYEIKPDVLAHL